MPRLKGRHGDKWFMDWAGKFLYNEKTKSAIYVVDKSHAKQLRLIQDLNDMRYIRI